MTIKTHKRQNYKVLDNAFKACALSELEKFNSTLRPTETMVCGTYDKDKVTEITEIVKEYLELASTSNSEGASSFKFSDNSVLVYEGSNYSFDSDGVVPEGAINNFPASWVAIPLENEGVKEIQKTFSNVENIYILGTPNTDNTIDVRNVFFSTKGKLPVLSNTESYTKFKLANKSGLSLEDIREVLPIPVDFQPMPTPVLSREVKVNKTITEVTTKTLSMVKLFDREGNLSQTKFYEEGEEVEKPKKYTMGSCQNTIKQSYICTDKNSGLVTIENTFPARTPQGNRISHWLAVKDGKEISLPLPYVEGMMPIWDAPTKSEVVINNIIGLPNVSMKLSYEGLASTERDSVKIEVTAPSNTLTEDNYLPFDIIINYINGR